MGSDPNAWTPFGGVAASAAATLVGLLFVAVSVQGSRIRDSVGLRSRAAQALILFTAPLVAGFVVASPGQATVSLGIELTALAIANGALFVYFNRRAEHDPRRDELVATLGRVAPFISATVLLALAGLSTATGLGPGLALLLPALLVYLIGGMILSWLLLLG